VSSETLNTDVLDRVNSLRKKLAGLATFDANTTEEQQVSTGCESFDALLPGGSLRPGMLVEFLSEQQGSGASAIAVEFARRVVDNTGSCLVVTDRWRRFYPPAAVARGIETKDLIVVRSSDQQIMSGAEELWALDQALRCPGVGVVMAWLDKVDPLAFRRLQLAAESGQTLALLMRPARVQSLPTWSDVQLLIQPHGKVAATRPESQTVPSNENRFCQVTLLRQRGRAGSNALEGTSIHLEVHETGELTIDSQARPDRSVPHEARTMHMAPRVAHPASRRRQAGA